MNEIFEGYGIQRVRWSEPGDPERRDVEFESATPLRAEEADGDDLGVDYDPGQMGTAEIWFRDFRGDE